jgi:hypothetical protein
VSRDQQPVCLLNCSILLLRAEGKWKVIGGENEEALLGESCSGDVHWRRFACNESNE